jgi:hypothetical protein
VNPHPLTVASLVLELLVPTVIVSQSSRACLGVQNMMFEVMVYGRYIDIEVMVLWTKKLTWGFGLLINMMSKLINIIHGYSW